MRTLVLICIAALLPGWCFAQELRSPFTVPPISSPPHLDGVLEDAAWSNAWTGTLQARDPGMKVEPTKVYVAHDGQQLYVAFNCSEPTPEKIRADCKENGGPVYSDDVVEIFLNPTTFTNQYLHFAVNSLGTQTERGFRNDGQRIYLRSGWSAGAKVHADRWIAEMAIPFAELGLGEATPTIWTANFCRVRRPSGLEASVWQGGFNQPATWAKIEFKDFNFAKFEGAGRFRTTVEAPLPPVYQTELSDELAPRLRWLKTDRLRMFFGWPISTTPRVPGEFTTRDRTLDRIVDGGFNAVSLGGRVARSEDPWMAWIGMRAMVQAWQRGLHVFADCGYLWGLEFPLPDPPPIRKMNQRGETDFHSPIYRSDNFLISPLDMRPWQLGFNRAADAYAYANELGLPDLLEGVYLDDEPLYHQQEYDHSDEAFGAYFQAGGMRATIPPPEERHGWLLKQQALSDFQRFQEQEDARRIQQVADAFYERRPEALVFVYNYMKEEWADRAWVKALSSPRRPTILMDDQTYYTGHSGAPQRVPEGIKATRALLGHEPMYCGAILPVIDPPYPAMSPDRAAQETCLLTRVANGSIVYSQQRRGEDMYDTHLPYWPGWRKTFDSLQRAGIIQIVPVAPRSKKQVRRADAALAKLDAWAKENWFKVWTPQPRWRHIFYTDPPAVRAQRENATIFTKKLFGQSPEKQSATEVPNYLSPCHSLRYSFTLPAEFVGKQGTFSIKLKPREPAQTHLQIVVNDVWLPLQGPNIHDSVTLSLPTSLLLPTNSIEIAYFYGNSIYRTIFDHWIELHELSLEIK